MRFRSILVIFACSALFLAACGSDDDSGSLSDQVEQSDTTEAASEDTQAPDETTADDGTTDATTDATSDLGDLGDDLEGLGEDLEDLTGSTIPNMDNLGDCLNFSLAYASVFLAGLGALGGMTEEDVAQAQADLEELQGSVPEELADDFATVSEAYSAYWEELVGTSLMDMGDIEDPMQDPDVAAADENINAWLDENCS